MQLFKKLFEENATKNGASAKQPIKVFDHPTTGGGTVLHSPTSSYTTADELMKKARKMTNQSFANRARHGGALLPP